MAEKPYSRIYHRLMTEYPTVWRSPVQLGLYVRLLVAADKFYPEWPTANRRNGAYQSLLKAGLVIEKEGTDGYTILGLEADRERRSHAASNAAASRWGMPKRDETSREKTSNGNGQSPTSFMRYPDRKREPERLPGEAVAPIHDGRHGKDCGPCAALLGGLSIEQQQAASLEDAIRKTQEMEAGA